MDLDKQLTWWMKHRKRVAWINKCDKVVVTPEYYEVVIGDKIFRVDSIKKLNLLGRQLRGN